MSNTIEGSKSVEIAGIDDKSQLIAMLAATASGTLLPAQVIYGGKTQGWWNSGRRGTIAPLTFSDL